MPVGDSISEAGPSGKGRQRIGWRYNNFTSKSKMLHCAWENKPNHSKSEFAEAQAHGGCGYFDSGVS